MGIETLKQAAVVSTAFLFCCSECVRGLFLGATLLTLLILFNMSQFFA